MRDEHEEGTPGLGVVVSRFAARVLRVGMAVVVCLGVAACSGEKAKLEGTYKTAATGRSQASVELRKAFYEKSITATAAIDLAHERLEKVGDANSVAFAGAVLDFVDQVEPDITPKVINEFYWIRLGTLAGSAAAAARTAGDLPTARSVVLAGPKRWQNDAYWRQHPSHDALASIILFESGDDKEALARLNDRPDLAEEVQQAKDMIEREMNKRKRGGH